MKYKIICLLAIAISLVACTKEKKAIESTSSKEEKVDALANRYLELGRFSGTILITRDNSVLFYKSYGLADYNANKVFSEETAFKIGTLSELFITIITQDLASLDKIELDEKVSTYLPEITGDYTINDLLLHQSGLPSIHAVLSAQTDLEYNTITLANAATINPQNLDSDLGYNVICLIIERILEKNLQEVLSYYSTVWNLKNTYIIKETDPNAAKGYFFHNFRGQGLELQEAPTYEQAFSSVSIKSSMKDVFNMTTRLPKGSIRKDGYLQADGFSYVLSKDERTELNVIILSNRKHPIANELATSIEAIYGYRPYQTPLLRKAVKITPAILQDYVGSYAFDANMNLEVLTSNDSLFVMMGPNKMHLIPQSENQFYMFESDASIRFLRDANETVSKAVLLNGFLNGKEIEKL